MENTVLIIHVVLAFLIIILVLLQKLEIRNYISLQVFLKKRTGLTAWWAENTLFPPKSRLPGLVSRLSGV